MAEMGRFRQIGLCSGLALALAAAGPGAAQSSGVDVQMAKGQAALLRGDGLAAETAFKAAQAAGASHEAVAAGMGEALLDQGKGYDARNWLGPMKFARADRVRGLRALARLEVADFHLPAAGKALDAALAVDARNAEVWADIAQLRYRGGEQVAAIDAIEQALKVDPRNVRALQFRGLIVRDQYGAAAALSWFEAALLQAPDNAVLLGDYAATLGEAGQASKMLTVTRHMLAIGADGARAFWLQAVLAARAGNFDLSRAMLNKMGGAGNGVPAVLQLDGLLQIEAGNGELAIQSLDRLAAAQPLNERAQELLARAMALAGQQRQMVDRFAWFAQQPGASPYMQTLVGRALEDLGRREEAAPLLDRAAAVTRAGLYPVAGNAPQAVDNPKSAGEQVLAGDVSYAAGQFTQALDHYSSAAKVRFDDALLARLVLSAAQSGQPQVAASTVAAYLKANPHSREAMRLAADYAASAGDWNRARGLLEHLRDTGGGRDVRLLADLAYAQLRGGDKQSSEATAAAAWRLQRSSPVASQAWAMALAGNKDKAALAANLIARTRQP